MPSKMLVHIAVVSGRPICGAPGSEMHGTEEVATCNKCWRLRVSDLRAQLAACMQPDGGSEPFDERDEKDRRLGAALRRVLCVTGPASVEFVKNDGDEDVGARTEGPVRTEGPWGPITRYAKTEAEALEKLADRLEKL